MKQVIRLTEGELHKIIGACVNEALNELDPRTYAMCARKRLDRGEFKKAMKDSFYGVQRYKQDLKDKGLDGVGKNTYHEIIFDDGEYVKGKGWRNDLNHESE